MELQIEEPVAILGFGTEGQSALAFLKSQNIKNITICDQNPDVKIPNGVKSKLGANVFDDLTEFKTIIRSPGVKYDLQGIQNSGSKITSMTSLTMQVAGDRVTAITGSNGKTTTVALTRSILSAHYGKRLITGGNDHKPILMQALKRKKDPILMEVSSFQYADLKTSPYISAIINITPNHLDWHDNFDDYVRAKANLLSGQGPEDWAVLNADDENTAKFADSTRAQQFWIGQKRGDNWAVWEKGHLLLSFDGKAKALLHKDDLRVKTHPDNILFAAAIAKLHIVPHSTIIEQIKLFNGVEHRLEYVRTVKDVHFYNDSASTVPESAEVAIDEFPHSKLILILGGSSKEVDFSSLAQRITDNEIRVYLIGNEGDKIKAALSALGGEYLILEHSKSSDFKEIIQDVFSHAKAEDFIVLSPACASFDMFQNAKKRGDEFKAIVNAL